VRLPIPQIPQMPRTVAASGRHRPVSATAVLPKQDCRNGALNVPHAGVRPVSRDNNRQEFVPQWLGEADLPLLSHGLCPACGDRLTRLGSVA